jgi:hypothetical protein
VAELADATLRVKGEKKARAQGIESSRSRLHCGTPKKQFSCRFESCPVLQLKFIDMLEYPLTSDVLKVFIPIIELLPGYYQYALDAGIKAQPGIDTNNLKHMKAGAGD